jgi:hypothetical protein
MRPDEVAHFAPIPDPQASFRGMSWLTPLIREILSDGAATSHKLKYFENGGTPNIAVILPQMKPEAFDAFVTKFRDQHEGVSNAYRALFLAGGADVKTVGSDLKQIDFKVTQGAGETRIAAAAGVPPVIVGLSEGLAASTYSNYTQARRRFADGTIRPLWRDFCGSMSAIITVPPSAELWYDDRDIPFVQEDEKDAAEVLQFEAAAIASLVTSGYTADSVVAAVTARDLNLLQHSGLFSVQLQPAGSGNTPAPTANGAAASGREIVAAALNR